MTPKIIELIIEDGDVEAGLDGSALVEMPAHEANFEYFSHEESNTHYVLSDEEIPKVLQMFQAYGESQGSLEEQGFILHSVVELNRQEFQILADPNAPSAQDTPDVKFRYKYVGPQDKKNRTFCAEMMRANRVFRIEDVMEMSNRSVNPVGPDGYDMFTWRGSYNCRHRWVQLIYKNPGTIINKASVRKGLIDEDDMPGPDTRTTATIAAGNTPPRTGFAASNPDVSALQPYVDQVTDEVEKAPVLAAQEGNINVLGYLTRFFYICPGAIELFQHLMSMPLNEETQGMVRSAAQVADNVFRIEDEVIKRGSATLDELVQAQILVDDFKDIMNEVDEEVGMIHNTTFMDGHIMKIGELVKQDENFAEVGPRGGIKKSDKAPKSDTPNPNPKGEGTAKGSASGKKGAKVSAEQEKTLQQKVDDFNEKESNTKNGRASLGALKSVFQRGLGAFNVSHSPKVKSAEQWAYARVNAFLYLLKNGRPENPKYDTDYDLLPNKHPKSENMSIDIEIECDECGWEWSYADGGDEPFICKCGYDNTPTEIDEDGNYIISQFASFDDYPELIRQNAQKVLDYIDRTGNPNNCMTQVGKVRAQQLAQGKPISIETVKRMKAYITRHQKDLQASKSYDDGCGLLSMDAWGGIEALPWVERTINQYEEMNAETEMVFSVFNNEQRLVVGPAMIPDKMIIRRDEITGNIYYVYFTSDTIKKLQQKFMMEKLLDKTNIEHQRKFLRNVDVVESWIVEDKEKDKQQVFGMSYPKGTWMISMKVNDDETWSKVKDGKLKGFSVQGYFLEKAKFNSQDQHLIEEIKNILKQVV